MLSDMGSPCGRSSARMMFSVLSARLASCAARSCCSRACSRATCCCVAAAAAEWAADAAAEAAATVAAASAMISLDDMRISGEGTAEEEDAEVTDMHEAWTDFLGDTGGAGTA